MESRTKLLLGVLAFLVLFAVWIWLGPGGDDSGSGGGGGYDAATAPVGPVPGAGRAPAAKAPVDHVEELRFAALTIRPREYTPGRDPWRYKDPPPPPAPPP
ncbi:MAG TPA: hypothetical protein VKM72_21140, partial [Thermoanaerobaculia bacterium]|nr:hypothetical protein [Thermoanaerobaculia bacterium]